jgi:hypothetical protein
MAWDEDDLNRQRVRMMLTLPTEGDAALVFDDTGFAKQGTSSAGVARQYSGTLGKTGNCQVAVNCHYAERTIAWPVATRLYLPREWTDDPERLRKARVPGGVTFQTKPEVALGLLDQADAWGVMIVSRLPCDGLSMCCTGERSMYPCFTAQLRARWTTTMHPRFIPGAHAGWASTHSCTWKGRRSLTVSVGGMDFTKDWRRSRYERYVPAALCLRTQSRNRSRTVTTGDAPGVLPAGVGEGGRAISVRPANRVAARAVAASGRDGLGVGRDEPRSGS